MMDAKSFLEDLRGFCSSEGICVVIDEESLSVIFPDTDISFGNRNNLRMFGDPEELSLFSAYKIAQISRKRLPDPIHNRMIMYVGNYPFPRLYIKRIDEWAAQQGS